MKLTIKLFIYCLVLTLLVAGFAHGELVFDSWKETMTFASDGQQVQVDASAHVSLPEKYVYTEWRYAFDPRSSVIISRVVLNDSDARYSFNNNALSIECGELKNGALFHVQISYSKKSASHDPYLRQEWVSLPSWLSSAQGTLLVTIPSSYDVCSLHPEFSQSENTYTWEGVIPKEGFERLFKITPVKGSWDVVVSNTVTGTRPFNKVDIWYPRYFYQTGQSSADYTCSSNIPLLSLSNEEAYHHLMIDASGRTKMISTTMHGHVTTGKDHTEPISEAPEQNVYSNPQETAVLQKILTLIRQKENPYNLPLYIRIGTWVHDYITYDSAQYGKKLSDFKIISTHRGVCEHYAQLYESLCRAAHIPCFTIAGYAHDEDLGWDNHAWNMVYVDSTWRSVDPTWDLFSGILPISHIGFYNAALSESRYSLINYRGSVKTLFSVSVHDLSTI